MARKTQAQEKVPANLSREHMRNAIPKIEKRIEELKQFNVDELTSRSTSVTSVIWGLACKYAFNPKLCQSC